MHVHVVAASGTGMGSLAGLLRELGHRVTGSDVRFDPPIGPALAEWGVECQVGYDPAHLDPAPDLVVIGNVCRADNPEARAAIDGGLPYTHIAGALERFALQGARPLVVAGTHGKTTTTSLCAWLLDQAGLAPGYLVGGVPKNFGRSFRAARPRRTLPQAATGDAAQLAPGGAQGVPGGAQAVPGGAQAVPGGAQGAPGGAQAVPGGAQLAPRGAQAVPGGAQGAPGGAQAVPGGAQATRPPFVLEGDEYDTAFFEKTAKFLHYRAEVAILTSIEHDHIDIYPTEAAYFAAFEQFIAGLPEAGLLVANAADREVVRLTKAHARCQVAWYAIDGQDTHGVAPHWLGALATSDASGVTFDLFAGGMLVSRVASPLPGLHNLANTVAALGAAAQGYGARFDRMIPALADFEGIKRRQELLGSPGGRLVYDDFAHHPTAVRETLAALRAKHPKAPLIAVFEPRSATACRALHQEAYANAFTGATRVILAPLGRDLPPGEALDTARLAAELSSRSTPAHATTSLDEVLELVTRHAADGSVIALLSNGAFGGLHQRVLSAFSEA